MKPEEVKETLDLGELSWTLFSCSLQCVLHLFFPWIGFNLHLETILEYEVPLD